MSIITLEQYKEYTGINNPKDDVKLEYIVTYVNQFIEKYCGTSFTPTTVVDKIITTTTHEIVLPNVPIISIESLALLDHNREEQAITSFYLDGDLGIITLYSNVTLPSNQDNIKVSYTHGYTQVPSGLILPAIELITHMYKREYIKTKTSNLGESITFLDPSVIPVQVRAGLDLYRSL